MRSIIIFVEAFLLFTLLVHGAISQAERDALIALYNSTDGDNWTINDDWLGPPGTECNWYGVSCDSGRNHVISLKLFYDKLNGVIPPEIGNLIYLEELDLNWTQLKGSIPSEIGNLTNLWNLDLHMTQLSGNIPTQIGNLVKLRRLYIGWSELDGSIPTEIGFLTDLEYLNLYANQLSGSIPTEIWGLTALNHLDLGQNQLAGGIPSEVANLVNLESLGLESNKLNGSIPSDIVYLTNLKVLSLNYNDLDGEIPANIGDLTNLENLDLSGNRLSGTIPVSIANLANLSRLLLGNNSLSGKIPPELGNLINLEYLMLSMNQLTGEIPTEIGNLSPLIWLELSYNSLQGNIPPEIGNLTALRILQLDNNQFSGTIPTQLGNLKLVRELFLHSNQLTGSIPSEFGNMESLVRALLNSNHLNGYIPSELGNMANLEQLFLGKNLLSGTIPTEIGNLPKLTSLFLSSNHLSGSIPSQIGNLSNLTGLNLCCNQLSGVIPSTLWDLSELSQLSLDANQLTGNIPSNIINLSNLSILGLSNNLFSGNIPTEIGNLVNLSSLHLNSNQLNGVIPTEMMDLASLSYLRLDWNALYSMDEDLTSYINNYYTWFYLSNDFRTMQSTAPENLSSSGTLATSSDWSWLPISQNPETAGGYEILETQLSKNGPQVVYTTDSKADDWCRICLYPERHYEFAIRTFTDPHDYNDNRVVSEASPVVVVDTGPADSWVQVHFDETQAGPVFPGSASQLVPATALTFAVPPEAFAEASPAEPIIIWLTLPDGARLSQTLATGTETTTAPLPSAGEIVHDLAVTEYVLDKHGVPGPLGGKDVSAVSPHAVQLFRYVAGERAVWLRVTESTAGWTPATGDFIGFTIGLPAGTWPDTAASNWGAAGIGQQASTLFYLDLRNYTFDEASPDFPVRLCSFYQSDGTGRDTGFAPEHISLFTRSEEVGDLAVSSTVNEAIGDHTRVDLDGDGVQDLVTVSPDEARLTWRYGTVDGVYTAGDYRDVTGLVPRTVAAGDVTGDARPDILVGDGAGELLIFDWVSLFTVKDTRRPIAPDRRVKLAAVPADACLADVNADGRPDFLYVSPDTGQLGVRYGDAYTAGDVYTAGPGPVALVTGDFDGDGMVDVAVANRDDGTVVLFVNDGSGGFLPAGTTDLGGWPADLAAGRFGDDPWLDLALGLAEPPGTSPGAVAVLMGGPDKEFTLTKIYTQHTPSAVVVDNFDGLHFADILVGFADYEQLGLYVSTATGQMEYAYHLNTIADLVVDPATGARLAEDGINSVGAGTGAGGVSRREGVAAISRRGYNVIHFPRSRHISYSVVNLGDTDRLLNLELYDTVTEELPGDVKRYTGQWLTSGADTLAPGTQYARYPGGLLGPGVDDETCWIRAFVTGDDMYGLWLVNDPGDLHYLDGMALPDVWSTMSDFVLPVLDTAGGHDTEVVLINPLECTAMVRVERVDEAGTVTDVLPLQLNARGRAALDAATVFPGAAATDYLHVRSDQPLIGLELFGDDQARACAPGIKAVPLLPDKQSASAGEPLFAPHMATGNLGADYVSVLDLVNTGSLPLAVEVSLCNDMGAVIASQDTTIPAGGKRHLDLAAFLGLTGGTTGYLRLDPGGTPGLAGCITFGEAAPGRFLACLPLQRAAHNRFLLGHMANGTLGAMGYFTGLAIVNPAPDLEVAADLRVTACDQNGLPLDSRKLILGGTDTQTNQKQPQRSVFLLHDFMPGLTAIFGGYLIVENRSATDGILVFALFGDTAATFLSAIPATPLPAAAD